MAIRSALMAGIVRKDGSNTKFWSCTELQALKQPKKEGITLQKTRQDYFYGIKTGIYYMKLDLADMKVRGRA